MKVRVNISIDEDVLALIDELAEVRTDGDRSAWIAHAATQDGGGLTPKQAAKLRELSDSLNELGDSLKALAVLAGDVAS